MTALQGATAYVAGMGEKARGRYGEVPHLHANSVEALVSEKRRQQRRSTVATTSAVALRSRALGRGGGFG